MSKRKKYACSGISAFACSVGIPVSHVFNSKVCLSEKICMLWYNAFACSDGIPVSHVFNSKVCLSEKNMHALV
jgi:hypothetical protein